MGDYEKALPLYQRALEIYEKVLGPQHPDVATTLNNLAGLYYHTERYEEALPLLERSLKIFESKLGPAHPNFKTPNKIFRFLRLKWRKSEIYFTVCYHWRSYDLVCRYWFSNLRSEKAVRYATGDRDRVLKQ